MAENFPNMGQETDIQLQEAQKFPPKNKPKEIHTQKYHNIIIKMAQVKENFVYPSPSFL